MAVSRKARVALIFCASVLLVVATKTVVAFTRYAKAEQHFASVRRGDSRSSVIAKMGNPNYYAGSCGDTFSRQGLCY